MIQKEWLGTLPEADKAWICVIRPRETDRLHPMDTWCRQEFRARHLRRRIRRHRRSGYVPVLGVFPSIPITTSRASMRMATISLAPSVTGRTTHLILRQPPIDVTLHPISTHVGRNSDGAMSLLSPEPPRDITLSTRTRGSGPARVVLNWNGSEFDPGYVARYRKSDATDWIDAPAPTNAFGELVPTIATNWPRMWGVIGPNPNGFTLQRYFEPP